MRSCGVLLHISSLPSRYGIGTLGQESKRFIDFLRAGGQEYWQMLPIGPTGFGDSPYQSFSAFAGNPLLISTDSLLEEELIKPTDAELSNLQTMAQAKFSDFQKLFVFKTVLLKLAYERFFVAGGSAEFIRFKEENADWLDDYALFMALKDHFDQKPWYEWDDDIRMRRRTALTHYSEQLSKAIEFWKFTQFKFFTQWNELKSYAMANGVKIIGDIPIYVASDSADVWSCPENFILDKDRKPMMVSGCPPDAFAPTGQLWGNPVYDWPSMEKNGYEWWINRISYTCKLFNMVRIDHFRGFESFYAIHSDSKTAENGVWLKGPGMKLFDAVRNKLGKVELIAENLGFLTDEVNDMLKASGFPGMNVLEFAFDADNESDYMPHRYIEHSVSYIGTHDNDTALGWYKSLDAYTQRFVKKYLNLNAFEGYSFGMIRSMYASVSELVIIQMQDFLNLGSQARMNIPSTVGGNWIWRMTDAQMKPALAKKMRELATTYFRCSQTLD